MANLKTYTVKSGEDLATIARDVLGIDPVTGWKKILDVNPAIQPSLRYVGGIPYVTLHTGDVIFLPGTVADSDSDPIPYPQTSSGVIPDAPVIVANEPMDKNFLIMAALAVAAIAFYFVTRN